MLVVEVHLIAEMLVLRGLALSEVLGDLSGRMPNNRVHKDFIAAGLARVAMGSFLGRGILNLEGGVDVAIEAMVIDINAEGVLPFVEVFKVGLEVVDGDQGESDGVVAWEHTVPEPGVTAGAGVTVHDARLTLCSDVSEKK